MGETLSLSYYLGLPAKNVKTEFYNISSEIYSQNDSDGKIVLFLVTTLQRRER